MFGQRRALAWDLFGVEAREVRASLPESVIDGRTETTFSAMDFGALAPFSPAGRAIVWSFSIPPPVPAMQPITFFLPAALLAAKPYYEATNGAGLLLYASLELDAPEQASRGAF